MTLDFDLSCLLNSVSDTRFCLTKIESIISEDLNVKMTYGLC